MVLTVVQNVASALDVAYHRPSPVTGKPLEVLHRDIKPGNIRLTPDGEVKVLDFGIARSENFDREAQTTEYQLGSLNYMAPELLTGGQASPASDVYSLGVTFFECLARDRFGWAGESDDMHGAKLEKRLAELDMRPSGALVDDVLALLRAMMAFDPSIRPKPADVVRRARTLADQMPGADIEDWAQDAVKRLKDSEVADDDSEGELAGKVLFEELSTASFQPQALGMFHDEATLAVPGADTALDSAGPTKGRAVEKMILVLLLGIAATIGYFVYDNQAPDPYEKGRALSAKPPTKPGSAAEASPAKAEAAVTPAPKPEDKAAEVADKDKAKEDDKKDEEEESGDPVPIRVASMPMGLPVFVDGKPVGSTPLSGLMLTPGKHKLLIKDGSKSVKKTIRVKAKGANKWKYVQADGKIR